MDFENAERYWGRRIANHRLTSGILPPPNADDWLLLSFSGTFDGYTVRRDLRTYLPEEFLPAFQRTEQLPALSLTMARALLFGFGRWHHHTDAGGGVPREWLRCMWALTERIRELVLAREAGQQPHVPGSRPAIEDALMDAYARTVEEYLRWGGYRFHGWTDFPDTHNFQGPLIWSEADCALRFAMELERQFPRAVHAEFAIGKATRLDYEPDVEKRQRIDLVVSDLSEFIEDDTSQERFQSMTHGAFIEAKWLVKGWRGERFEQDATKRVASVYADVARLRRHLEFGRCQVAAVLVFDDEDYFYEAPRPEDDEQLVTPAQHNGKRDLDGPGPVWRLVVGPWVLREHGLLADFGTDRGAGNARTLGPLATQNVTEVDIREGRLRLPRPTCELFEGFGHYGNVAVRGTELRARWDSHADDGRTRSGVVAFGRGNLDGLVEPGRPLKVAAAQTAASASTDDDAEAGSTTHGLGTPSSESA